MRKLILGLSILALIGANAQAASCRENYEVAAKKKFETRQEMSKWSQEMAQASAGYVGALGIATAINPLAAPSLIVTASFMGLMQIVSGGYDIAAADNRESRILNAEKRAEKGFGLIIKILHKAQKIKSETTLEEVQALINQGFDSGDFCVNPKRLFTPGDVKKYVIERI